MATNARIILVEGFPTEEDFDLMGTEEIISAIAMLVEETATMQALVMIHGKDRGYERYREAGGHIGYNNDRALCFYWSDELAASLSRKNPFDFSEVY